MGSLEESKEEEELVLRSEGPRQAAEAKGRKNESSKGANRVSVMSFSRSATLLTSLPCSLVSASQYPDVKAERAGERVRHFLPWGFV